MSYPSSTLYPGANTFPGGDANGPPTPQPDGLLQWNRIEDRQIETGIDRGVLYLNNGVTVPWNGLTSVEEDGGEEAVVYYVDGRPFLHFPKPKEYKGVLKAYTYPDEFSSLIGELEITDGMYLNSQIGDSFGLSYRTRVFDAISGEDAAYKIHVIYNASVVPSSKTYDTIGSEVNPLEFSWPIQAVPVNVDGYRPTAHITIDTRHMDATRIAALETLLYGTVDAPATMPDAQAIFDLLNFGDTIVITDNGNGTWTAEGSYHNVYLTSYYTFQIDNVNAVDNLDETYDISSTP